MSRDPPPQAEWSLAGSAEALDRIADALERIATALEASAKKAGRDT